MKLSDLLVLGAVGYGAYWLYNYFTKPSPGGAVDSAESAIANLFSGTTPTAVINPVLTIQFPDGSSIPASAMSGQSWVGNTLTFPYNGSTWSLAPQVNNVYQATQLSGLGSYSALAWSQDPLTRSLGR